MNHTNRAVTRGPWNWSTLSGSGIPPGRCVCQPFRLRTLPEPRNGWNFTVQKGQLDGLVVTEEEADRLALLYGYTKLYGRNTVKFVASRAARRRGHTTTDSTYQSQVARHATQRAAPCRTSTATT